MEKAGFWFNTTGEEWRKLVSGLTPQERSGGSWFNTTGEEWRKLVSGLTPQEWRKLV